MATDIFTRAKAYRKKHPNVAWLDCVKACKSKKTVGKAPAKKAAKKKAAVKKKAVGRAPKKKTATKKRAVGKAPKKAVKKKVINVRIGTAAESNDLRTKLRRAGKKMPHGYVVEKATHSISGVAMGKITHEHDHQRALIGSIAKHTAAKKVKGITASAKNALTREITHFKNALKASKQHVTALKRSI